MDYSNFKPMLAKPMDYSNKNIRNILKGKLLFEPKLDGIRALAYYHNGEVTIQSRQLKIFLGHALDDLKAEIKQLYETGVLTEAELLDGELYIEGQPFNTIQSIVTNIKKPYDASLQCNYHIYDYYNNDDPGMSCMNRKVAIKHICNQATRLIPVSYDVWDVFCADEPTMQTVVQEKHDKFVSEGYEGLIIRSQTGAYQSGKRPNDLIKVKAFFDEEYEIVSIAEGKGKFVGIPVFTFKLKDSEVVNPKNQTFTGVLIGSEEYRKNIYNNRDKFIGCYATVKYFEKSEDNIPRFPTVIAIRNYE